MATILLVRHGQSTANVTGLLAGWSPGIGLTDQGRDQARALAPVIAALAPARVVSSPVQRCVETAELLSGPRPVDLDDGLGECHYGAWTGRSLTDLAKDPLWRTLQDSPESPDATFESTPDFPGESLSTLSGRLWETVIRLDDAITTEQGAQAIWVVVSHGDPIKSLLASASGAGVVALQRFHVDPGSVSVIRRHATSEGQRFLILGTNLTGADAATLSRLRTLGSAGSLDTPGAAGDAVVGGGAG